METQRFFRCAAVIGALCLAGSQLSQAQQVRVYNTVKEKLARGEQVVGGTVISSDPNMYCSMANAGYDFLWIEMQHSPLTYQEVARMIWACRDAPAIPFVRVPDATAGDIQKATDIGALGIIIPLVDTTEKIEAAVQYAHYPPMGVRSQGNGQYRALWGDDYRESANENVMIVAMIEAPAGVGEVEEISAVEGVDVVMVASTDLGSFSGLQQGNASYESMVEEVREATLAAGLALGGPQAWRERDGFQFFQGPTDVNLLSLGVERSLATLGSGIAPIEGSEP